MYQNKSEIKHSLEPKHRDRHANIHTLTLTQIDLGHGPRIV